MPLYNLPAAPVALLSLIITLIPTTTTTTTTSTFRLLNYLQTPTLPPSLPLAKSYKLFINVTTPALDFPSPHSVHGLYLSTVRAGATLNAPTVTNSTSRAAPFSTTPNSTTQVSTSFNQTTAYSIFMSESATSSAPNPYVLSLGVNAGAGTEGISVGSSGSGDECVRLETTKVGTFAVCDEKFEAYTHPRWLVVFVQGGEFNLPDGGDCVAVSLVPECDGLDPDVGRGGEGRVVETRCFVDVKGVGDWGVYGC